MSVYSKGGHEVTVSGEEAVAQFEAAGYSLVRSTKKTDTTPATPKKSAASKKTEK